MELSWPSRDSKPMGDSSRGAARPTLFFFCLISPRAVAGSSARAPCPPWEQSAGLSLPPSDGGDVAKQAAQQPERLTPPLSAPSQSCSPTRPPGNARLPPPALERGAGVCLGEGVLASTFPNQSGDLPRHPPLRRNARRLLLYPRNVRLQNVKPLRCGRIELAAREGILEEKLRSCMKAVASASAAEGSGTHAVEEH